MINTNNQSFKSSSIGLIPFDWEVKRLEELCPIFKSGNGITSENIEELGDYPVYGGNGLRGYTDKFTHEGRYFLIGRQGALCGNILRVEGRVYISEHAIAVQTDTRNDLSFLAYKLEYHNLNKLSESSAQPGLSVEKLLRIKIALPSLSEQTSIAKLLSTWDKAIEKNTQLIIAKEQRKKWLMQQLLLGSKRLKAFTKEWKHARIADIAEEVSIKNKADKELTVLSCTKYDGLVPSLEYFGRRVFGEDTSTYKVVPENHFAYATNHIEEGSIGYQSRFAEALISPMYTVFKTDGTVDDKFLYRVLKSHNYIHEYQKRMEGSIDRRGGLRWDEFSRIKIAMPSIEEQNAIDEIFQTVDKEINLLEQKLEAYKEQKKGLMQVLLTGKVRLKIL